MKRKVLKVVPILIMGIILVISSWVFANNKKQTYERVRNLKESQVQIIANQFDIRTEDDHLSKYEAEVLRKSVENINEQEGVYCYLFDKDCNLLSNFSRQHKHTTGEALIKALKENELSIVFTHEYHGYLDVRTETKEIFRVYWQGVPSGRRDNCEYFIILAVSEKEVQENEAIATCKVMIAVLTIVLGVSLYGNLYVKPFCEEKDESKEKSK